MAPPTDEVLECLQTLSRTFGVGTVGPGFPRFPHHPLPTNGTTIWIGEHSFPPGSLLAHGSDHLRNDVARPLDHDHISFTNVLSPYVVFIVEGRCFYGHSCNLNRLQNCIGIQGPTASNVDFDL